MYKRKYRVYQSPNGEIVKVKMGFSWRAFFVGSLTVMLRRVWLLAGIALFFFLSQAYFSGAPTPTSRTAALALALMAIYAVYMLFCGINGNRWLSESLRRRGFTLIAEEKRGGLPSTKSAVKKPARVVPIAPP